MPDQSQIKPFIPYNRELTSLARENRANPTQAERRIWYKVLCRRQFEAHKFLRQKPIGDYIVDFYCSDLRLVVEIDGDSHSEQEEYDARRAAALEGFGLTVVRYTNLDILENIEGVYEHLLGVVGQPAD